MSGALFDDSIFFYLDVLGRYGNLLFSMTISNVLFADLDFPSLLFASFDLQFAWYGFEGLLMKLKNGW